MYLIILKHSKKLKNDGEFDAFHFDAIKIYMIIWYIANYAE